MSEDDAEGTVEPLHASPRLLALVIGVFVVILGVPTALFASAGRWRVAAGMLGLWAGMVTVTAFAFRKAVDAKREGPG